MVKFYNDKIWYQNIDKKYVLIGCICFSSKDYRVARLSINCAKFEMYKTIPNDGRIDLNYRTASHNIVSNPE